MRLIVPAYSAPKAELNPLCMPAVDLPIVPLQSQLAVENNMGAPDMALLDAIASDHEATHTQFFWNSFAPAGVVEGIQRSKPPLNCLLTQYRMTVDRVNALFAIQRQLEKDLLGRAITNELTTVCISEFSSDVLKQIVKMANRKFGLYGRSLAIDLDDALEQTHQCDWHSAFQARRYEHDHGDPPVELDLDRLWNHLDLTYSGKRGELKQHRDNAATIVDQLQMEDESLIKRSARGISFFANVESRQAGTGRNTGLSYPLNPTFGITQLLEALVNFANWAAVTDIATGLDPVKQMVLEGDHYYALRAQHNLPGLDITFFKSKWEFRFSHEVAEKLNLFLGEFAPA